MTKSEAKELNELFEAIKNKKENNVGLIDLSKTYKDAHSLKDKEWPYIVRIREQIISCGSHPVLFIRDTQPVCTFQIRKDIGE